MHCLKTEEGRAFFARLQQSTAAHFAASDDLTGNTKGGTQDWVMESDGVNIKDLYFRDTSQFDGAFGESCGAMRRLLSRCH